MGKLPWYVDYFIYSCGYNSTIDFIIITDDRSYAKQLPNNVRLINSTLGEINRRATQVLGFATNITNGYKLCDFKPAYGLIFADLLKGYNFWVHADLDVVFGDIRAFITRQILRDYDLISVRHDFLTGQFLIFRNTDKINNLFTLSKDYQKVLAAEQHYCFDETNFQWDGFTEGRYYTEIASEVESMTHLVKRLAENNYLKVHFDFLIVEGSPGKMKWQRGKLIYRNRYEILLYHLVLFKKVAIPKKVKSIPDSFSITPTRFRHGI
jgi:hypothetical protein